MMTKKQIKEWRADAENELLHRLTPGHHYILALAMNDHQDEIARLAYCDRIAQYENGEELAAKVKVFTNLKRRNQILSLIALGLLDKHYKLTKLGHKYWTYKQRNLLR